MTTPGDLPGLVGVEEVRRRLEAVFPESFPDRALLVGEMAARAVFVFLYGGFLDSAQRHLRPIVICRFSPAQARRTSESARRDWLAMAFTRGFRCEGRPWYADNTRESIRDDLFRARLVSMGIVGKKAGVPTTSSAPIYSLNGAFAALFDPAIEGSRFTSAVEAWRDRHLAPEALKRMALKARGALERSGDVLIDMPDRTRLRVSAGPSTPILKALIEDFAPRWLIKPAVLWVSASDRKTQPHFIEMSASIGLRFDASTLLPDLILADVVEPLRVVFCEVVATDGPIDPDRKAALLGLARSSGIEPHSVQFVSAYLDREAAPLRKTFHRIAAGSDLWFSSEPDMLVRLVVGKARSES